MATTSRQHGRRGPANGIHADDGELCAAPGCVQSGYYRAPRTADDPGTGRWRFLCLDHVRAFNAGYNYFAGMDEEAIRAAQHPLHGWADRTAWIDGWSATPRWHDFSDPLDAIAARFRPGSSPSGNSATPATSAADRRALQALGLNADADRAAIRRAYSERLRRFHPDRNGGDRRHEDQLQQVIEAYAHLRGLAAFR